MDSARAAYDLLMAEDREAARNLAQIVDRHNMTRKSVENDMMAEALTQVKDPSPSAVVVNDEAGDGTLKRQGVCGIVASRLADRFGVPVAVSVGGRGSVRAPEGYDVHAALTSCADLLERFGGHTAAGGFTVKEGRFADFRVSFTEACAQQRAAAGTVKKVDFCAPELWVSPEDLTMELYEELQVMEPFGEGNPEPVLGLHGVMFADAQPIGESGKHAVFSFSDKRIPRATWWGRGDRVEGLRARARNRYDISFTLDVSDWGGEEPHLELRLCGVSSCCAQLGEK